MRFFAVLLLTSLIGCSTISDDRICLEWKSQTEIKHKCIPMYGNMICADEERVRHWCVLYEEPIIKPEKE